MFTALLMILLLLAFTGNILSDHIPFELMENATRIFTTKNFPCVSKCLAEQCIASAWDEAAAQSRRLTAGCKMVLYSVAIDDRADSFHHIDKYWGEAKSFWGSTPACSVLFLSDRSEFRLKHKHATRAGNWHIVPVKELSAFSDNRKASKLPKLFPHSFFAGSVDYALYIDTKLRLLDHPSTILHTHLIPYIDKKTFLTIVRYHYNDIAQEVAVITRAKDKSRPTITHNLPMLEFQRDTYTALNITGQGRMVDTAILLHNLRSVATRSFFCTWEGQLQKFSDRDQIAFEGTVGWFSRNFTDVSVESDGSMDVKVSIASVMYNIHLLPAEKYSYSFGKNSSKFKFAVLHRHAWNA
jgi:hypothetical protein